MRLRDLISSKRILVCVGPGGVGKTTSAASLGVLGARAGRATLVATIDPAPRLIDALSLPNLGPQPAAIPDDVARALGVTGGPGLSAARIDPRVAFDGLVTDFVRDQEALTRILGNTIYRQITTTLSGAQEYAATLALHGFARDPANELIVLDTPPTANAMEFFEAPARISAAIESAVIKWLVAEQGRKGAHLLSLKRLSSGGAVMLGRLARLVGSRFLDDLASFLADFEPVLAGFLQRTQEIDRMLRAPDVAILVVCAPEAPATDEAMAFVRRLADIGLEPSAFIINRMWPRPGVLSQQEIVTQLGDLDLTGVGAEDLRQSATIIESGARMLHIRAKAQDRQVRRLRTAYPEKPVSTVPLALGKGNLAILRETAAHLDP